jgi:hypothetical protein
VSVAISSMMEVEAGSASIEASREEAAWSTAKDYAILDVEFTVAQGLQRANASCVTPG